MEAITSAKGPRFIEVDGRGVASGGEDSRHQTEEGQIESNENMFAGDLEQSLLMLQETNE